MLRDQPGRRYKMKKILFILSLLLTVVFFVYWYFLNPRFTAEIRGNENRFYEFDKGWNNTFHFILKAENEGVVIYEGRYSCGYFTRSFSAQDKDNPELKYYIKRGSRNWTKNVPSKQKIKKGDVFITDINLCDETWEIEPKLPTGKSVRLFLQGHYDVKKSRRGEPCFDTNPESDYGKLWYGHLDTNVVEITIRKGCIDILNNPTRRY